MRPEKQQNARCDWCERASDARGLTRWAIVYPCTCGLACDPLIEHLAVCARCTEHFHKKHEVVTGEEADLARSLLAQFAPETLN